MALAVVSTVSTTLPSTYLATGIVPRPVVTVVKRTSQALGAVAASAAAAVVGTVVAEARLSENECDVSVPLRARVRFPIPIDESQGISSPLAPNAAADAAERTCIVIGGGFTGVATAYFLARRGFDVTVLERRRQSPATEVAGCLPASAQTPPGELLGPLAAMKGITADALGGLSPWTALRLWWHTFSCGVDLFRLRGYWGDLHGEGSPQARAGAPREIEDEALKLAAAAAASRDRTFFVDWASLAGGKGLLRFAYCWLSGALVEVWQTAASPTQRVYEEEIKRKGYDALCQRSATLLQQVASEERLQCQLTAQDVVHVNFGSSEAADGDPVDPPLTYLAPGAHARRLPAAVPRSQTIVCERSVFMQQLETVCRDRYGVRFRYGAEAAQLQVDDLEGTGRLVGRVQCTDGRRYKASYFVLANGSGAPHTASSVIDKHCSNEMPVYLPFCGVRSYTLSLPISSCPDECQAALQRWPSVEIQPLALSVSAATGNTHSAASSGHVRLSAMFEVAAGQVRSVAAAMSPVGMASWSAAAHADSTAKSAGTRAFREKIARASPALAAAAASFEIESRRSAQTPDDLPVVSGTRFPNLFVNSGHGCHEWELACGASEMVADLIEAPLCGGGGVGAGSQQPCAVDPRPFSLRRFAGAKLFWRPAHVAGTADSVVGFPELAGQAVGPVALLRSGPALPVGRWWLW